MISVTVAAQGKKQRLVGGHLKAYGSGRVSIFDLDKSAEQKPQKKDINIWIRLFSKLLDIIYSILVVCFPFIFNFLNSPSTMYDDEKRVGLVKKNGKRSTSLVRYSAIQILHEKDLALIFSYLDPDDISNCELACKKWARAVDDHIDYMPKIQKDQIRFLFDEGEVVVYPIDEKRCPSRFPMPSLQVLARKLRHLRSLSLFVRGLIPVEAVPVLKALGELSLAPTQIYLIWCKFSPNSTTYLAEFLHRNMGTLSDLGLEECTPGCMITDSLLTPLLPYLISLRVWNDGKSGGFSISDATLLGLADSIRNGGGLETVDIACASVSPTAVATLIDTWSISGSTDLSLSLSHCPLADPDALLNLLALNQIYFENGKIIRRGLCLSLFL